MHQQDDRIVRLGPTIVQRVTHGTAWNFKNRCPIYAEDQSPSLLSICAHAESNFDQARQAVVIHECGFRIVEPFRFHPLEGALDVILADNSETLGLDRTRMLSHRCKQALDGLHIDIALNDEVTEPFTWSNPSLGQNGLAHDGAAQSGKLADEVADEAVGLIDMRGDQTAQMLRLLPVGTSGVIGIPFRPGAIGRGKARAVELKRGVRI